MLSIICFLAISSLAVLSLTRYRILVICGLYSFYALLTVLDEGHVPRFGPLTIYRALYLILGIAVVALVIQDSNFLLRMRRWPVFSYIALLILVLGSALYSQTNSALDFDDSAGVWNRVVVLGLFWMSAALVQEESDVKFFGITSAGVALVLSLWVIWSASQFDFEALRGGVAVNQNHISVFVLAGAIPLVNCLFSARSYFFRVIVMLSLLLMMLSALILASRGMIAAFAAGAIFLTVRFFRRLRPWTIIALSTLLFLVITTAFFLPGAGQFLARFQEDDVGTFTGRTLVWSHSLRYFSESGLARMIFGQGFSSETFILGPVMPPGLINYHNEYLQWLMGQGIVGLLAFLALIYGVGHRIVVCADPLKDMMLGWFVFLMVAGMTATVGGHYFWIPLGVMVGTSTLKCYVRGSSTGNLKRPAMHAHLPLPFKPST